MSSQDLQNVLFYFCKQNLLNLIELLYFHLKIQQYFELAKIPPTLPAQLMMMSGFFCLINFSTLS